MTVLLGVVALGLLAGVVAVLLPKDLSGIAGYPAKSLLEGGAESRNLLEETQAILFQPGESVEFSEEEFNDYLNARLGGEQKGLMGSFITFEGIYADVEPDTVEFFVERKIFGMPTTMSTRLRLEYFRGLPRSEGAGGTIGKINLSSKQLQPIVEAFTRVLGACRDEALALQHIASIRFEKDKVVLATTL